MNRLTNRLARSGSLVAGLLTVALLLPACSPAGSGSLGTLPTGPPSPEPAATAAAPSPGPTSPAATPGLGAAPSPRSPGSRPAATDRTITIELWLTRDGTLFPTRRTRPSTLATSRLAMTELAAGPSAVEAAVGVRSGVAAGLSYELSISGGVATVDLPGSFYDGGRDAARLRQAQVVYSLTQFPTVSTVGFQRGGSPAGSPVGRADYRDLLPPIVVTSLVIGQSVTSPVTVAGTANVFEANVTIRILDAAGAPLATTFTTATCGSGCRGDYSTTVSYRSPRSQPGTVQVYEVSAENGSRINVVNIPVSLAAS
jgi:hypothetical protein